MSEKNEADLKIFKLFDCMDAMRDYYPSRSREQSNKSNRNQIMKLIQTTEENADVTIYDMDSRNCYTWEGEEATVAEVAEAYAASYDADFESGPVRIRMEFSDETVWGSFGAARKFTADNKNHF